MTKKLSLFLALALGSIALLVFYDLHFEILWYSLELRSIKVASIIISGISIAVATVVFQTIFNNRILTPSMIGLNSVYVLFNTLAIVFFGTAFTSEASIYLSFFSSVFCMMAFSVVLYYLIFVRLQASLYIVALVGIVMGGFLDSFSLVARVFIDPDEYLSVQDTMFASFNNVNSELLAITAVILVAITTYLFRQRKTLDLLTLGKDGAINLGVDYKAEVKKNMLLVCTLIALSTALVGPISFLGFLVVNMAKTYLSTFRHSYLFIGSSLLAVFTLAFGQFVVEHVFAYGIPVATFIYLVGGIFFIFALLKDNLQ